MSLRADIALTMGTLAIDVGFTIEDGRVLGLVGPNAAGKTTLLRALAGLAPLACGRVVLDGEVLDDTSVGVRVLTERRPIGVVFQDYRLFPHLSALDNVAFGLRSRGIPRAAAQRRAADWLKRVGLDGCAHLRPKALSGGQAQRVALARALVTDPRLLLLDEPLAALDAGSRAELRHELQCHLAGFAGTCVLVTHDLIEAVTLADELVVIEAGKVTQAGSPEDVSLHPRSRYVADLVGVNLYRDWPGRHHRTVARSTTRRRQRPASVGRRLCRGRTEGRRPVSGQSGGLSTNAWSGTAEVLDAMGDRVRVRVNGPVTVVAEVTPRRSLNFDLATAALSGPPSRPRR